MPASLRAASTWRALAGLIWPDSSAGQALTNLRRELHHLRRTLGEWPVLDVTATHLCWQPHREVRVDLHSRRAAETAAGLFAHAEAIRLARTTLDLVGELPRGADRDRQELGSLARAAYWLSLLADLQPDERSAATLLAQAGGRVLHPAHRTAPCPRSFTGKVHCGGQSARPGVARG